MNDDPLGPGFDTVTLIRPTPRKLACLWMEQAGLRTLLLPTVWEQLTRTRRKGSSVNTASWQRIRSFNDAPFRWIELTDDQQEAVEDVLHHFTEPCFPKLVADQVPDDPDANIVAEALVLGTDVLVTQDINSINHDEINFVIEQRLGRNTGFVITLDRALSQAFPGGDCANHLLTLALATIAPTGQEEWSVDDAHKDLGKMLDALAGANVRDTAARLGIRWDQCRDLDQVLMDARTMARNSRALQFERLRAKWQREAALQQSRSEAHPHTR